MSSKSAVDCCRRSRKSGGENGQSLTLRVRSSPHTSPGAARSAYGSGRSSTALTTLKIAVQAPMPSAIVIGGDGGEAEVLAQSPDRVQEILEEGVHVAVTHLTATRLDLVGPRRQPWRPVGSGDTRTIILPKFFPRTGRSAPTARRRARRRCPRGYLMRPDAHQRRASPSGTPASDRRDR